jgi:very-short-patch-repair endonuclease
MRAAVALADGRAESPPESRLRVVLALAGRPAVPQYTVRDAAGNFVARVDLAYPDRRVAIEYDGAWHGERGQLARDRRRHNRLVAAGWTVLYVTAADMHDPESLVARVEAVIDVPTSAK